MKRFFEGEDRRQATLLPDSLEDYVAEDNLVCVIDVFIDELDLGVLGFPGVVPEATRRSAYHTATLLKIYHYGYLNLYGYLNRIQSGRFTRDWVLECRSGQSKIGSDGIDLTRESCSNLLNTSGFT